MKKSINQLAEYMGDFTCSYQLGVSRGPHNTILGHALVEPV